MVQYNGLAPKMILKINMRLGRGQIHLQKTGTYAIASLRFFQDVSRVPRKAENLLSEKDHYFNKFYPNILAYDDASWPIRAGKFKTITHKLNYYNLEYSIYRAFIKGQPTNQKCIRGFCYNPAGYYTHYDLKLAMKLDLHIELSSESPNALIFDS
ncbi:hypothetical protein RhiirA5_405445 [Rhizophagus irregularis]|uniref:Uncharacterized protein n=1 Tax=Rhizophagus irregularis TaxID=588596 RepID=A0A2N0QFC3_9GLOM|nr:hypothetical protein RhiirA5_405445 [Rhizophagus irregularis]